MIYKKICKNCNKQYNATRFDQEYCCRVCYEYYRYHYDPKHKAAKIAYFNKWRKDNRKKFNLLMREGQRRRLGIKPENYKPNAYKNVE